MKSKLLLFLAATVIIISSIAVKPAVAFFTDQVMTEGKLKIALGDGKPVIEEEVENMIKRVSIKNTGEYDIFVRAKAIYPDSCTVTFMDSTNWSQSNDGYYYYSEVIAPGDATEKLNLKIEKDYTFNSSFNVVIIQEATKVLYDEAGNTTADWEAKITTQEEYDVR